MTTKTMLGLQVKSLLSSLSDRGMHRLSEIEADLAQTSFLLNGAIEKLSASFLAMHAGTEAQRQMVDALLSGAAPTREMVAKLKAGRNNIDGHVNAAVTGLQFQDMTSQLIGRTVACINDMREILVSVGAAGAAVPANAEIDELMAALGNVNKVLEETGAKPDSGLWRAVSQTHMDSGDVELF